MAKLHLLQTAFAVCAFAVSVSVLSSEAQAACTTEKPCTVPISFRYTEAALADIKRAQSMPASAQGCMAKHKDQGYCLFDAAVEDDVKEIAAAFERLGIAQTAGKRKSIVFVADKPRPGPGIDGGVAENLRADRPTAWRGGGAFNNNIAVSLGSNGAIKAFNASSDINLFVLLTGFRDAKGGCIMSSVQTNGFIVLPACMITESVLSERHKVLQKLLFMHEAGHSFGAGHDDNADPGFQPCVGPAQLRSASGLRLPLSAERGRELDARVLHDHGPQQSERKALRRAQGGARGHGLDPRILAHAAEECATPLYQAIDCGDATHDNAKVMSANAPDVARLRPGDALPRGSLTRGENRLRIADLRELMRHKWHKGRGYNLSCHFASRGVCVPCIEVSSARRLSLCVVDDGAARAAL